MDDAGHEKGWRTAACFQLLLRLQEERKLLRHQAELLKQEKEEVGELWAEVEVEETSVLTERSHGGCLAVAEPAEKSAGL